MLYPDSLTASEALLLDVDGLWESRHMPMSFLGLGCATELHKAYNLSKVMLLETGTDEAFSKFRFQVRGYCSDQGVEAQVSDAAVAVREGSDAEAWTRGLAAIRDGRVGSDEAMGSYLLPYCLYTPDHLHTFFGALEGSVCSLPSWTILEKALRSISNFLRDHGLKGRFSAVCLKLTSQKRAIERHTAQLTDWKWEYLHAFTESLGPTIPLLVQHFDEAKMRGISEDGSRNARVDNALIASVAEALKVPLLAEKCAVLRFLSSGLGRMATWCEGCRCHQHIMDDQLLSVKDRATKYRNESSHCAWKGKRGVELASGELDRLIERFLNKHDRALQEVYASLDNLQGGELRRFESEIRTKVEGAIRMKLGFWKSLPHSLLAIAGGMLGMTSEDASKAAARACIAEYQAAVEDGAGAKVHRVAQRFLSSTSLLRPMLVRYADSDVPLRAMPELALELKSYAMTSIVCRRIEAVHSAVKSAQKSCTRYRLAWVAARVRRLDVCRALDAGPRFREFLEAHWRRRNILKSSLRCMLGKVKLVLMSMELFFGYFYQYSNEALFADHTARKADVAAWKPHASKLAKPAVEQVDDSRNLLVQYFKHALSKPDVMWSLPSGLVASDLPEPPRTHVAREHLGTVVDVSEAVCSTLESAGSGADFDSHTFFQVLHARPENRKVVRPSHKPVRKTEVQVIFYRGGSWDGDTKTFSESVGAPGVLDLTCLARADIVSQIVCWEGVEFDMFMCMQQPLARAIRDLEHMAQERVLQVPGDQIDGSGGALVQYNEVARSIAPFQPLAQRCLNLINHLRSGVVRVSVVLIRFWVLFDVWGGGRTV